MFGGRKHERDVRRLELDGTAVWREKMDWVFVGCLVAVSVRRRCRELVVDFKVSGDSGMIHGEVKQRTKTSMDVGRKGWVFVGW